MKSKPFAHKDLSTPWSLQLGANKVSSGAYRFLVWAPLCSKVDLKYAQSGGEEHCIPMDKGENGYFSVQVDTAGPGTEYYYVLEGVRARPDPVSRSLPKGVHGPTEIIDPSAFHWSDQEWKGSALPGIILYEAHMGTFTAEGTFMAAIKKIPYLKKLGINCLEIMPVAQFPGERNWGYDGASMFAVQNTYGGPEGLKSLINACHAEGIAVCLDVVYNHFGPEGNYLREFGPYFSPKYHVPWGDAVNYDGPGSDEVRRFITDNARFWISEYHADALRLDAVHGIFDFSAFHILHALNQAVKEPGVRLGRQSLVIAESDLNDPRLIRSESKGGYGLDAQWSDDFHHAIHALLTSECNGYYQDFGHMADIVKAVSKGFVYDGQYSAYRGRCHGDPFADLSPEKLVVTIQNHDQVGNRELGERFGTLLPFEAQKLAASLLLLSVNTPLLFMGEEFGEKAPFQYFIDHADPELVRSVREGRAKEFPTSAQAQIPDPKSPDTYFASKLHWDILNDKPHSWMLQLYEDLIRLRKIYLSGPRKIKRAASLDGDVNEGGLLMVEYTTGHRERLGAIFSFSSKDVTIDLPFAAKKFNALFYSADPLYGGVSHDPWNDKKCLRILPLSAVFGIFKF